MALRVSGAAREGGVAPTREKQEWSDMAEITGYAPGTPSWIDLITPDMEAAKAFYGGLFGWERTTPDPKMGGYAFFLRNGKQACGVAPITSPEQHPSWTTYIATADADATTQAVRNHGGHVVMEPMDVMDTGRMALFTDPTGAFFGVWQPGTHTGAQVANEAGAFCWNELLTRDMDAAKAFYPQVFSWGIEASGEGATAYTQWQVNGRSIAGGMAMPDAIPAEIPALWRVYFGVANCDATVAKAQAAGGALLIPAVDSPNGRFAVLADPFGASFAVIQVQ